MALPFRGPTLGLLVATALLVAPAIAGPAAAVLPRCAPPDCIAANFVGYAPPVTAVRAGDEVRWASLDILHTSTEGFFGDVPRPCVDAWFHTLGSAPVVFTFDPGTGALFGHENGRDRVCATAEVVPGGALLRYYCRLHPWMNAALFVVDA